ncbi:nucleoside monophosphate kinase [Candidatus Parcubacteria bacterium]|nr:nucleoside monophosphate kinase [Candidatus Parcubacteria bacterium]
MKDVEFPLFKTKTDDGKKFDLTDPAQRKAYFELKAGDEIKKLQEYLKNGNTFIVYLLGKKSSGKGTYSKMFKEIIDKDKIEHVSVGDMIRSFDEVLKDPVKKQELEEFLKKKYRGPVPPVDLIRAMEARSTKVLLPSELILALVEREITRIGKKVIFLDGFPRDIDQVSYSMFFKNLIDYRNDPDIFVLIDVPITIIDQRVKQRVICPLCNTSRSLKLLTTKNVQYDKEKKEFFLMCDNPACTGARMVTKEGDEHGIDPIRTRLEKDEMLMKQIYSMHGLSRVLLRNSIPVDKTPEFANDYEVTPEYYYTVDEATGKVETKEKAWELPDDEGTLSNSLMPPPVVVSLIKQLVRELGL